MVQTNSSVTDKKKMTRAYKKPSTSSREEKEK